MRAKRKATRRKQDINDVLRLFPQMPRTKREVKRFFRWMIDGEGDGFHPDDRYEFADSEAERHINRLLDRAAKIVADPSAIALEIIDRKRAKK